MVDTNRRGLWTHWALFFALASLIVFVKLLPLNVTAGGIPGPDVLLLVAVAWVVRRPEFVPVPLIAAVFLTTDLLFMRAPGLWTAIVILGLEYLRVRSVGLREVSVLVEWLTVSVVITAMFLVQAAVLTVFLVDQPALGLMLMHLIATLLAYPVVVALAARAMGLRKILPGEVDQLGHRR